VGNQATCNFQGFLLQLAIGAPLYNCSLALCYLLTIMYDWSNDRLALMGRWVHMFIISFSVGTSILLLPLGQYNQITQVLDNWIPIRLRQQLQHTVEHSLRPRKLVLELRNSTVLRTSLALHRAYYHCHGKYLPGTSRDSYSDAKIFHTGTQRDGIERH
jgi:hypothetical protein